MPYILKTRVDPINYKEATQKIIEWAEKEKSRYVCAATVHMVMEAFDSEEFCQVVNNADLVTADGMPLVWMLRLLGHKRQERCCGPELILWVNKAAAEKGIPVGFYGSTPEVLQDLKKNLLQKFPKLKIVYMYSPPFRPLLPEEEKQIIKEINQSGARILFVGLGCPKQERWMARHRGKIRAVMLGVGAAFDFHAGHKPIAPKWMQNLGLEWLFRLCCEPRRLWRRYLYHNPRFLYYAFQQIIFKKQFI